MDENEQLEDNGAGQIDLEALESRAVERAKAELRAELAQLNARNAQAAPVNKTSRVQELRDKLIADNVSVDALDNYLALHKAIREDEAEVHAVVSQREGEKAFVRQCYQVTLDALEEVLEPLPQLKDLGTGLLGDMAEDAATLVMSDSRFADVARAVKAGQLPSPKRMKEAAALIVDKKAKTIGIKPKAGQLDLNSSKPQPKDEDASPDDLPREARAIYALNKNLGLDHKTAMARAKAHAKERM